LARAEFAEIADAIKQVAILAGIAIGAALAAGLLLSVGLPLFVGEWIFGSIGWGVLHGLLLLVAIGVAATVVALGVEASRIGASLLVGAISAVVVAVVLWLGITNRGWAVVGDALLPAVAAGDRPLASALMLLPLVAGILLGLLALVQALRAGGAETPTAEGARYVVAAPIAVYAGWLAAFLYSYATGLRLPDLTVLGVGVVAFVITFVVAAILGRWRATFALLTGLSYGILFGFVIGALSSIAFGGRVATALGVTVGLAVWSGVMGAALARRGVDGEELMQRFVPRKTIDMTKETIEWARERMPLSRRS
jgi:hypothetical protein